MDFGNPCSTHPSDHFSIGYTVMLRHPGINESSIKKLFTPSHPVYWAAMVEAIEPQGTIALDKNGKLEEDLT